MNKFKYYFILLLAGVALVSCNKSDDDKAEVVPLRDYKEQYKADNDSIEKYLKTNYFTVTDSPGTPQDQDVVIRKITNPATQRSIMSYLNSDTFPKLLTRDVYSNDVTYKVYYLVLREGTGNKPTNTDKIIASYSGNLLDNTVFDTSNGYGRKFFLFPYDANTIDTFTVIEGWSEIFPQFRTGTSSTNNEGVVTYSNFGAGVMFLPSGLAYYGNATTAIPAYTPIVFSFKLFNLEFLDHDHDGVYDYQEDVSGDGYMYDFRNTTKYPTPPAGLFDDTDGDLLADFIDIDDDGDGYTTTFEITKPTGAPNTGISKYYPFNPISDNPNTPNTDETETYAIPRRPTGELTDPSKPESINNPRKFVEDDYKAAGRKRIHVDKTYPYQKN